MFTDSARTNEVASNSSVKIQDTSTTPAGPGYTITPNKTSLDEGDSITFTVATTNVAENTTLHWQVLADTGNVDANDFGSGEFAGSDQISSGGFTITQNVANDATTEGAEKYTIVLYPDNTYDWPSRLAQSALVTINDELVNLFLKNKISFNEISDNLIKLLKKKEIQLLKKKIPKNFNEIRKINEYVRLKTFQQSIN